MTDKQEPRTPLMECGHNGMARNEKGEPACIICVGIHPGAEIVAENQTPFDGRKARCAYYGSGPHRKNECNYDGHKGKSCTCERDSSNDLPFFEYIPDRDFDLFYCGCHGWD